MAEIDLVMKVFLLTWKNIHNIFFCKFFNLYSQYIILSNNTFPFISVLFHLVWCVRGLSMLYHLSVPHSFFSSVTQPCLTLCDLMECSTPVICFHHQLPELPQTHVYQVGDPIQPSHPLSSPSPLAFNLSQHQGLFQWVSSSHQVAKVLEL